MVPDLDCWIPDPVVHVVHRREVEADPAQLWTHAREIRLSDTRRLGRLVRWRIPGVPEESTYDQMFRSAPFNVLAASEHGLVSGIVGRIWTFKRDYPILAAPEEFRAWRQRGTVRVLFATWVQPGSDGGATITNDVRIGAVDRTARISLGVLAPLISASHGLIGSEGLELAASRACA